jgi:hypothetical protein
MKKVGLDVWIQLIGMLSIVASLIFVGLEMRQTQQIAIAGQVQARAQMQVDRLLTGLEGNLDIYRLWNTNNFEYEDLHEDEKVVAGAIHNWKQAMLENNFFQYRAGLFAEGYWEQTKGRIQNWYDLCELRPAGQSVLSFQEYLNSLPDNCTQ